METARKGREAHTGQLGYTRERIGQSTSRRCWTSPSIKSSLLTIPGPLANRIIGRKKPGENKNKDSFVGGGNTDGVGWAQRSYLVRGGVRKLSREN